MPEAVFALLVTSLISVIPRAIPAFIKDVTQRVAADMLMGNDEDDGEVIPEAQQDDENHSVRSEGPTAADGTNNSYDEVDMHKFCEVGGLLFRSRNLQTTQVSFPAKRVAHNEVEPDFGRLFGQGEIYRSIVQVDKHFFVIAGTNNADEDRNPLVANIAPDVEWKGDLVLLSMGRRVQFHARPAACATRSIRNKAIREFVAQVDAALNDGELPPTRMRVEQ